MTAPTDNVREILDRALENSPEEGIVRLNREIFTDEEIFELEMKYIFEGNWIFLAHESQIPNVGDYFTTNIGRQPVVITRSKDGKLNCLINSCSHRGAMLCRRKVDNRTTLTCPFHGWTFSNDGTFLKAKDEQNGAYPNNFNTEGSHDLRRVPKFESYRGFLFGSLNDDVVELEEFLGDTRVILDMLIDQSPEGLEVLKGASTYTYDGNWKLQAENGADGYHVSSVHWNYAATTSRRSTGESANDTKAMDAGKWGEQGGGYFSYPYGHLMLWSEWANPEDRPIFDRLAELKDLHGEERGTFMVGASRNLCLYPNVYIMDQFSTQIRRLEPVSVDKTEVTIFCIAPKGESAENRAARIRQYEDFFNATGMATPDDLEEFRSCQKTYRATSFPWNDMTRGLGHQIEGASELARSLGMDSVLSSGARTEDEGLYPIQHAYWEEVLEQAVEQEEKDSQERTSKNVRNDAQATKVTTEHAQQRAAKKAEASANKSADAEVSSSGRRVRRKRKQ
ncbi:benzoate 1,2-dioxygenase large subunit [Corynebacterium cystitidis]|uniref:Benzoate 1,2-dioxygenase, alpha subunit n=1 Tax=Corynebacterium cystitidis DSM 20524 TaxID=1121357 RepID=A0A1H9SSG5_9CORY|nr:benzoate 1,2-dioxygenase large subunit [Corynebacterium cystitidis]WJY83141.1 2-halobenzoate 1,2-dioxygenase large subunit [Corynebacterium cystitidis DSM 20524]SER87279.1 benzoate 1,2-dioxygenase, alpha subunit [Corynebacterium cystitidis DSM 20524]SNV66705.1 benzoate 1,2-dioxygenase subunit alpha [Corynebacterium cystitidis]